MSDTETVTVGAGGGSGGNVGATGSNGKIEAEPRALIAPISALREETERLQATIDELRAKAEELADVPAFVDQTAEQIARLIATTEGITEAAQRSEALRAYDRYASHALSALLISRPQDAIAASVQKAAQAGSLMMVERVRYAHTQAQNIAAARAQRAQQAAQAQAAQAAQAQADADALEQVMPVAMPAVVPMQRANLAPNVKRVASAPRRMVAPQQQYADTFDGSPGAARTAVMCNHGKACEMHGLKCNKPATPPHDIHMHGKTEDGVSCRWGAKGPK